MFHVRGRIKKTDSQYPAVAIHCLQTTYDSEDIILAVIFFQQVFSSLGKITQ